MAGLLRAHRTDWTADLVAGVQTDQLFALLELAIKGMMVVIPMVPLPLVTVVAVQAHKGTILLVTAVILMVVTVAQD